MQCFYLFIQTSCKKEFDSIESLILIQDRSEGGHRQECLKTAKVAMQIRDLLVELEEETKASRKISENREILADQQGRWLLILFNLKIFYSAYQRHNL